MTQQNDTNIDNYDKFKEALFHYKFDLNKDTKTISIKDFKAPKKIKKPLRIGTVFSGIGAFEHALEVLNIPHTVSFACDNGGNEFEGLLKGENVAKWQEIQNKIPPKLTEKDMQAEDIKQLLSERLKFVENVYKQAKKKNFVRESYLANYNLKDEHFYHDVRFIGSHVEHEIDVFVGGSPCQSFSIAGQRGGFEDTRGTLFFEYARLVKELQPKVFIYENVRGLTTHDNKKTFKTVLNTFDDLGYKYFYKILNAKHYGIPQSRDRIFIVGFKDHNINFEFPKPQELTTTMADFLIGNVDAKYTLSDNQRKFVSNEFKLKKKYTQIDGQTMLCQRARQQYNLHGDFVHDKYFLSDKVGTYVMATQSGNAKFTPTINTDIAKTLVATMHKMHRANMDNYVTVKGKLRRLTPRECLRLMGFLDSFTQVVSDVQAYKQAGNSIVVDVLMAITQQIVDTGALDN